ncbi:MAG: hypothetical protein WBD67_06740 [Terracidiphilus sp.]
MACISRMEWIGFAVGVLGIILFAPFASAKSRSAHPYRYSVVDVPVSLAVGAVRTPEFSPRKASWYWIMVQVEKPLPFPQMICMMGVTSGPLESKNCTSEDPLLRADWTVWSEGQVVSSGSSTTKADAAFTKENIFKFLGKFPAEAGKKYVLEVKFTKDGTPLNVANPHLIVTRIGDE